MKIVQRDISYILRNSKKYFIIMIILACINILYLLMNTESEGIMYFFDSIMYDSGMLDNGLYEFSPPFMWIMLHLLPVYWIIDVFYKDHVNYGIYNMLKVKTKREYFASKIITGIILLSCTFGIYFILIMLITTNRSFVDKENFFYLIRIIISLLLEDIILTIIGLLIAVFISMRVFIFALLTMIVAPMISNNKYLLGQASLVFKQDFMGGRFILKENLVYILIYLTITLLAFYFLIPKYNHYGGRQ